MTRRRKASAAEDLMDLVTMLPWWAGVALALLFYFVLHAIAAAPMPVAATPKEIGRIAASGLWRSLAYAGQYALPFICLMGALASAIRRTKRKNLVATVSRNNAADALEAMSWREFELLVGEGFRAQGFSVVELGGNGPDGGVDLVLTKLNEKFLVQCKQWKAFKVGVSVVRELYGVMAARGATGGFVVTSGQFTDDAKEFSHGRNIHLVDGPELLRLLRLGRSGATIDGFTTPDAKASESPRRSDSPPACPVCDSPMVRRVAKRGASAGSSFWGCSGYPRCKGTLPA